MRGIWVRHAGGGVPGEGELGKGRAVILPSFLHEILGKGMPWQSHDNLAVCPSLTVRV